MLAVVDSFSKFIVAEADQRSKSSHYCKCISRPCVYKKWLPQNYSNGSGSTVRSEIFSELGELMGFTHWSTTPYHQFVNGQVEWANQTLRNMVMAYSRSNAYHWDKNLQQLVFAYNNSINSVTKETPFFLIHGWDFLMPLDTVLVVKEDKVDPEVSEFKRELAVKIGKAWELAKSNIDSVQQTQKRHYDKKRAAIPGVQKVRIGDLVLVKVEVFGKLDDRWTGPYRVVAVSKPNVTLIVNGKPKNIYLDKTKKIL